MCNVPASDKVYDEAIAWFARLRADDVSATDRQRFFDWLGKGDGHQLAFAEILRLWDGLDVLEGMSPASIRTFPALYRVFASRVRAGVSSTLR